MSNSVNPDLSILSKHGPNFWILQSKYPARYKKNLWGCKSPLNFPYLTMKLHNCHYNKLFIHFHEIWNSLQFSLQILGRYGLYAPSRGGLDMLDLRHGTVLRTLIPKIAEGIFTVICKFNATNEYVLYYHRYILFNSTRLKTGF